MSASGRAADPRAVMPVISLIQLDTSFPRIPGDIGAAETWACDVDIKRVPDLSVARVINAAPENTDIGDAEMAVRTAKGDIVTTSCGFLIYWQDRLAAQCRVPFISSALMDLPRLMSAFPGDKLAILTFDSDVLASKAFAPALGGFAGPIIGLPPQSHLRQVIAGDLPDLDALLAEAQLVDLVGDLLRERPVRALLLECTNLPPYKQALKARFDLEIFDILTLIDRRKAGMVNAAFT